MDRNSDILKAGLKKSIVNEWKNECHEKEKKGVDIFDINTLSERIYDLPEDLKALLFMKEIYNLGPKETERIFNIENASDKCKFAELLLALAMNLSESQKISEKSLKKATEIAFRKYIEQAEAVPVTESALSFEQKKKFRDMGINTHHKAKSVLKKAVIIALVSALSLALAISSSAKLRSEIYKWIVKAFPEYSSFTSTEIADDIEEACIKLEKIKILYYPKGFKIVYEEYFDTMYSLQLQNGSDRFITFNADVADGEETLFNTEGVELKEIMLNDSIAYTWEKDGVKYIVWKQKEYEFSIIGNIEYKELFKMAKSIKI